MLNQRRPGSPPGHHFHDDAHDIYDDFDSEEYECELLDDDGDLYDNDK